MLLKKVFLFQPEIQRIGYFDWFHRIATVLLLLKLLHPAWLSVATDEDTKAIWLRINSVNCFSSISPEWNGAFEDRAKCCEYFWNYFLLFVFFDFQYIFKSFESSMICGWKWRASKSPIEFKTDKKVSRYFRCFHNYHHPFGVQKNNKQQTGDTDLCTTWQF